MNTNFIKVDSSKVSGTSFHNGIVKATANEISEVLGNYESGDGDKVNREWVCKNKNGIVFTVYDWKEGLTSENEILYYHIGTLTKDDTYEIIDELKNAGLVTYMDSIF